MLLAKAAMLVQRRPTCYTDETLRPEMTRPDDTAPWLGLLH